VHARPAGKLSQQASRPWSAGKPTAKPRTGVVAIADIFTQRQPNQLINQFLVFCVQLHNFRLLFRY
jgi:hypothetical protein